jgi:hypothetical protein
VIDDLMCPRIAGTAEYEWLTWQEIAEEARRDTPVVKSVPGKCWPPPLPGREWYRRAHDEVSPGRGQPQ